MIAAGTISFDYALEIANHSRTVKCLALVDILFSFMYILLGPYFAISAIVSLVFGLCGYYGAKNYNKSQTFSYFLSTNI